MTLALANATSNNVLSSLAQDAEDIVVEAPPGSGKTHLLESCAALSSLHLGRTTLVACNTNEQANDITRRMAIRFPGMRILRIVANNAEPVPALSVLPNVAQAGSMQPDFRVAVTTVAKLIESPGPPRADVLMIDEAFQLKHGDFMLIRGLAPRALHIGDPGQIDPIVPISVRHWAALPDGPHLPAPRVVLARAEARRFQLPLSRRLPADSADIVRTAFYPGMNFTGLASPAERRLGLCTGMTRIDGLLDAALACGSFAAVTLPHRTATPADPELVDLLVGLIHRIIARGPVVVDGESREALQPADIGVVVSRREQVTAVAQALGPLSRQILVETANRFQGLERKVVLTIHPLSGHPQPSGFELNPGRMCVSISRHRVMCILLARTGVQEVLTSYMPNDDRFLGQPDDPSFVGWRAHEAVWRSLCAGGRLFAA